MPDYKSGGAKKDACYHKVKARYTVWPQLMHPVHCPSVERLVHLTGVIRKASKCIP